jgi:hypothetical protein
MNKENRKSLLSPLMGEEVGVGEGSVWEVGQRQLLRVGWW